MLLQVSQGDPSKAELNMGFPPRAWTQKIQFSLGTGAFQCLEELCFPEEHQQRILSGHVEGESCWFTKAVRSSPFSFQREEEVKGKVINKAHNDTNL